MDNSIQAHQKELCNKLWAMANALRGNMEAYEFKNYILGMIFYYYLSDRTEKYMTNLLKDDNISYEDAWTDEEYKAAVVEEALRDLGFVIEPQFCSARWLRWLRTVLSTLSFCRKPSMLSWSPPSATTQDDFEGCSPICSLILLSWGIRSKTEVLLWQKSLPLSGRDQLRRGGHED